MSKTEHFVIEIDCYIKSDAIGFSNLLLLQSFSLETSWQQNSFQLVCLEEHPRISHDQVWKDRNETIFM